MVIYKKLTYNIIIRKAQPSSSSDATLSSLSVTDYPFISEGVYTSSTFAKDTSDYSIGRIPYGVDKLQVNYTATQGTSSTSILVNGVSVARDATGYVNIPLENNNNGVITVVVIAPNGTTTKTYNIHYRKEASSNAKLSNMVVSDGTLSPTFDPDTLGYEVELPEGTSTETITVTVADPGAKLFVGGQQRTSPYVHTITGLSEGTNRATFNVTAEDGTTLTYYIDIKAHGGTEKITSINYGHTIADGMIKTVAVNVTIGDLKQNQLDNDAAKLQVYDESGTNLLADTDLVATGQIVKLIIDGNVADQDRIVVNGDVNGDGEIDLADSVMVINHYIGKTPITTDYVVEAADVNKDTDIDLADSVMIINHYIGKTPIHR